MSTDDSLIEIMFRAKQVYLARYAGRVLDPHELLKLTRELGTRLATAVFYLSVLDSEPHQSFNRELLGKKDLLPNGNAVGERISNGPSADYEVTIVASQLFQSGRQWGDHAPIWKKWARDLGFTTDTIETDAKKSIVENARIIHQYLNTEPHLRRILVTYGQGASEFRFLLQRMAPVKPTRGKGLGSVLSWINIAGSFNGQSTYRYSRNDWRRKIWHSLNCRIHGRPTSLNEQLSPDFSLWKNPFLVPPNMMITSVVGLPFPSQLPPRLLPTYQRLGQDMPNDGVVNVLDSIIDSSLIVPVLGMSHAAEPAILEPVFKRLLLQNLKILTATLSFSSRSQTLISASSSPEINLDQI